MFLLGDIAHLVERYVRNVQVTCSSHAIATITGVYARPEIREIAFAVSFSFFASMPLENNS